MRIAWYILVVAHAFFLMVLSYYWLQWPYTYDNEGSLISLTANVKNVAFHWEDKPDKADFLLINTSYEKQLVPRYDEDGFEIGIEAVTDRARLALVLEVIASSNEHRAIFCDIFLRDTTGTDSTLVNAVSKTKRILFPYHIEDEQLVRPSLNIPLAYSDYQSDFGKFFKYKFLHHDTLRSVALALYEMLHNDSIRKEGLFYYSGSGMVFNSFILDFPVRQFDIFRNDSLGFASIHIADFLALPEETAATLIKNRIIIAGDFLENDMHETIHGTMAGPLIHLNAYLNLIREQNRISIGFLVFLFLCYFIFSWFLFSPHRKLSFLWLERLQNSKFGGLVVDYLKYAFFLLAMSVLSYLLFGIHLNVLILSLYISIVENAVEFLYNRFIKTSRTQYV